MAVVVVSVGTSLLTNNIGRREVCGAERIIEQFERGKADMQGIEEIELKMEDGCLADFDASIDYLYDFADEFLRFYLPADAVRREIEKRKPDKPGRDRLPSELSSLYFLYCHPEADRAGVQGKEQEARDEAVLLTTETPDSFFCAKLLRLYLEQSELFDTRFSKIEIETLKGLKIDDPETWAPQGRPKSDEEMKSGLNPLFGLFDELKRRDPEGEAILIRTGGYKELSAFLMLFAINFGFKSYYLFEKSERFLTLHVTAWPRHLSTIINNLTIR